MSPGATTAATAFRAAFVSLVRTVLFPALKPFISCSTTLATSASVPNIAPSFASLCLSSWSFSTAFDIAKARQSTGTVSSNLRNFTACLYCVLSHTVLFSSIMIGETYVGFIIATLPPRLSKNSLYSAEPTPCLCRMFLPLASILSRSSFVILGGWFSCLRAATESSAMYSQCNVYACVTSKCFTFVLICMSTAYVVKQPVVL